MPGGGDHGCFGGLTHLPQRRPADQLEHAVPIDQQLHLAGGEAFADGTLPRRVRDQFNGALWRFRTGYGWRDVPERYGPWSTVCSRFNAWVKVGVCEALMNALIAEAATRGRVGLELISVDSRVVRAHHESSGLAIAEVVKLARSAR